LSFENHTVSVHYARAITAAAARRGYDTRAMLRQAAIPEGWLDNPEMRITPEQLAKLMLEAWITEDDEFLGMAPGRCRFGVFALMARPALHCKTLQDVYRHIARFYNLTSEALELRFDSDERLARLSIRLAEPEQDRHHMLSELLLLLWHRFPAWLIGKRIPLHQLEFDYPIPPQVREYRLLFPGPMRFNAHRTAFSFPAELLAAPVVQTAETLKEHLRRAPLDWFKRQNYYPTYTRQVLDALAANKGFSNLQIDEIAAAMHLSSRTLRRKLTDEGTSFLEIKNLARCDSAIHLLSQQRYSIGAIAQLLGYSEAAAFSRAFKEWTGVSPQAYKAGSHPFLIS